MSKEFSVFRQKILSRVIKTAFYVFGWIFWGNFSFGKHFNFYFKFRSWAKIFRNFGKNFQHICHLFRTSSDKFLDFMQKKLDMVIKTVFYVSRRTFYGFQKFFPNVKATSLENRNATSLENVNADGKNRVRSERFEWMIFHPYFSWGQKIIFTSSPCPTLSIIFRSTGKKPTIPSTGEHVSKIRRADSQQKVSRNARLMQYTTANIQFVLHFSLIIISNKSRK